MSFRHVLLLAIVSVTTLLVSAGLPVLAANAKTPVAKQVALTWIDAETGTTLFTINDLVRFDWEKQIFELKPERATELLALPIIQRRDFAVKDADGVVYRGRFYRTAAAGGEGYDGTTILIGQDAMKTLPAPPFFQINGGYQVAAGTHDRDRFSPRIHDPLAKAGVLTRIGDTVLPFKRSWSGHTWVGGEQVLKASAILFEETFRNDQDAYLHLLLYKGQHPDLAFDKLVAEAICTSVDGKFISTHELLTVTPPLLDNGIYVCKFRPWDGMLVAAQEDDANKLAHISQSTLPRYPKDAVNENREGTVVVSATVGTDGKASDVQVVQSSNAADLDKSAVRNIKTYRFTPAMVNGQAIKSVVKIQVVYRNGKVEQSLLPPDPIEAKAAPGIMDLTITLITFRKDGDKYLQTGKWTIPTRKVKLLAITEK